MITQQEADKLMLLIHTHENIVSYNADTAGADLLVTGEMIEKERSAYCTLKAFVQSLVRG